MPASRVSPAGEPPSWSPNHAADGSGPFPEVPIPTSPSDTPPPTNSSCDPNGFARGCRTTATTTSASSTATTMTGPGTSPYQRLMDALGHDDRWQKDVALGRRVGFYRFKGDLGSGNFSQVKVAVHCLVKEKVAIKILDKSKLDAKTQRMLTREIAAMESLHHPHIIRLYEVIETLSRVHLVMEFAHGGELFQKITSDGKYAEEDARLVFAQVASALDHMHQHNIIHRDLKAENVFIAGHNVVKVGDFGFSTQVRYRDDSLNTFCGSPPYAAPELFKDENYVGPYVDIWALGVLLYFMVTSTMPFKAQTVTALKKLILEGQYQVPAYLSEPCKALITAILQVSPADRITLDQVGSSEWLRGQRFPESYPKYSIFPSLDSAAPVSEEDLEARTHLEDLGISEDMMRDCVDKGARNHITGAYRIMLHKIQTAPPPQDNIDSESAGTATGTPSPGGKPDRISNKVERLFSVKNRKSRTCVLL